MGQSEQTNTHYAELLHIISTKLPEGGAGTTFEDSARAHLLAASQCIKGGDCEDAIPPLVLAVEALVKALLRAT